MSKKRLLSIHILRNQFSKAKIRRGILPKKTGRILGGFRLFSTLDLITLLLQSLQKIFVVFGLFRQNSVNHAT